MLVIGGCRHSSLITTCYILYMRLNYFRHFLSFYHQAVLPLYYLDDLHFYVIFPYFTSYLSLPPNLNRMHPFFSWRDKVINNRCFQIKVKKYKLEPTRPLFSFTNLLGILVSISFKHKALRECFPSLQCYSMV